MIPVRVPPRAWNRVISTEVHRKLRSGTARRVLKNVLSLSAAQGASYLLALLVLPYTASVLGPKSFGMVALTQAVVQYSTMVTNYGFAFSATREAAVCQSDRKRLAEIIVEVWTAKFLLMMGCLGASVAVFAAMPSLRPNLFAYLCGFSAVLGSVLYVDWFFQAIEDMKWITITTAIPKLALTPLIFVLVKAPADYIMVILIQSATILGSGIAGAAVARRRLGVALPRPEVRGLKKQLKEGFRPFLGMVSVNLYTSTNVVLLGLMTNVTIVGYYSAGQKVIAGLQSLWTPIFQSLYPHFCKGFEAGRRGMASELRQFAALVLGVTLAGAGVFSLAAPYLVPTYLGPRFQDSVSVIQILVFSVCAVSTNTVLGLHGMLASGLYASFLRVVAVAALGNLLVAPIAILQGGHLGLALSTVLVEAAVGIYEYSLLRRNLAARFAGR